MAFSGWRPEIVVGIDFGMTGTAIAYSWGEEWARPEAIQHWPGSTGGQLADKVPSVIAYDLHTEEVATWGFLVDQEDLNLNPGSYFKLHLDPAFKDGSPDAPTNEEARKWFRDFLACVYKEISQFFSESFPRWSSRNVEFLFSTPTTWKSPAMIATIEKAIKSAGFGRESNHVVRMSLTEAEAAAVYASKQHYEKGDVFLVCDAGGGTSDVNILKVESAEYGRVELRPLSYVEGEPIGSTLIDLKVTKMLLERLETIRSHLRPNADPRKIAEQMMKSTTRFESFKKGFGSEAINVLDLPLTVPGLPPGLDFPQARIFDSRMIVTKEELRIIFDDQLEKIYKLIDEQLKRLQLKYSRESISYLVLSGGLGSSPYVQKKLKSRYETGTCGFANAQDMKIKKVDRPQMAVVLGLVWDRIQQLKINSLVYTERCCRNSYGIVVREPYDPARHIGEKVVKDPRDKKKWAERQIHWFIKQGETISVAKGVMHPFRLKINFDSVGRPWKMLIVMSALPLNQLPKSFRLDGSKSVCAVESVLPQRDMKLKNRHWYNFGPQYFRAQFDVKVIIGPSDLKFQLVGLDGIVSKDHEEITVQWTEPIPGATRTQESVANEAQGYEMYRR